MKFSTNTGQGVNCGQVFRISLYPSIFSSLKERRSICSCTVKVLYKSANEFHLGRTSFWYIPVWVQFHHCFPMSRHFDLHFRHCSVRDVDVKSAVVTGFRLGLYLVYAIYPVFRVPIDSMRCPDKQYGRDFGDCLMRRRNIDIGTYATEKPKKCVFVLGTCLVCSLYTFFSWSI
jgi:hypothetical protein